MIQQNLKLRRRLVDIVEDFRQLLLTIGDNDGEIEGYLLKELDDCEEAFETKVDSCLMVSEEFSYQAEMYKKRAKALADHAKAMQNRADRLRELVREGMIQLNIQKMKTPNFSSVYLKTSERMDIKDPNAIADVFDGNEAIVQYPDPKISKTELKRAIYADANAYESVAKALDFVKTVSLVVR